MAFVTTSMTSQFTVTSKLIDVKFLSEQRQRIGSGSSLEQPCQADQDQGDKNWTSINSETTVNCDLVILVVTLVIFQYWSEPIRPADDVVGTAKTFLVSEILEVVLKLKKIQLFDVYHYVCIYIISNKILLIQ